MRTLVCFSIQCNCAAANCVQSVSPVLYACAVSLHWTKVGILNMDARHQLYGHYTSCHHRFSIKHLLRLAHPGYKPLPTSATCPSPDINQSNLSYTILYCKMFLNKWREMTTVGQNNISKTDSCDTETNTI